MSLALQKRLCDGSPYGFSSQGSEFYVRAYLCKRRIMSQLEMFEKPDEEGEVIYRMTIRTKSGKVIRRANGQPFRIVIRPKKAA